MSDNDVSMQLVTERTNFQLDHLLLQVWGLGSMLPQWGAQTVRNQLCGGRTRVRLFRVYPQLVHS
jgi:hypothetical protein